MNITKRWREMVRLAMHSHWNRQRHQQLQRWAQSRYKSSSRTASDTPHLLFLSEEFFHSALRGYGGFGQALKYVTDNYHPEKLKSALAYAPAMSNIAQAVSKEYHGVPVIMRPYENPLNETTLHRYADHLASLHPRVMLSIDWYPSYEVAAHALPDTPLIVWVRDPRDQEEWKKIAAVPDELRFRGVESAADLIALADEKEASIKRLLALRRKIPRKIIFAVKASSLVPRAERTYGIGLDNAYLLPTPIDIPTLHANDQTERPSLLFMGRLDAVKRPWIAFELARRHPDVDFLIAGQAHNTELMEPWLARYPHLPNLQLLGHVDGVDKDRLLRSCWGLLNTSVHESIPMSFLEAFAYGKCVIACHTPDPEIADFCYFTGEVPGEGLDEDSLQRFDREIKSMLHDENARRLKGQRGREEMVRNHTLESFERHLDAIFANEMI